MLKWPFDLMKIAIAADHAGYLLKEAIRERLVAEGHEVADFGTDSLESTDYPDYARAVSESVVSGEATRGVLVCSTGVGMSIAANKVNGIRAALAVNHEGVALTRQHNDANVLAFGAKFTNIDDAAALVDIFLNTPFDGGARHARRIQKIAAMETAGAQQEEHATKA
jgi:ribose 5-phosphate isomerase B